MPEPRYKYQDPDGDYVFTRSEVLAQYFAYWSERMRKVGKADQISEDACIEDWKVVHWAWELDDP